MEKTISPATVFIFSGIIFGSVLLIRSKFFPIQAEDLIKIIGVFVLIFIGICLKSARLINFKIGAKNLALCGFEILLLIIMAMTIVYAIL